MKIAYLVPGSGGSFYCGNCTRDKGFTQSLRQTGNDILMIPMYLPLTLDQCEADSPIFYGAVNLYLEHVFPVFKNAPGWLKRMFDSEKVLRFAARQSGSTSAVGNESMTISMLKGEHGNQSHDLDVLINWLREHEKPDVVHLSNALLSGLAPKIKRELGCAVICTLQDEDEWVDAMREPYASETWKLIESNAGHIDAFIAVSDYYAGLISSRINISPDKLHVVHNPVPPEDIHVNNIHEELQTIGYMSKINSIFGADLLFEAFAELKRDEKFKTLKLIYTGGYTDDYKKIVGDIKRKARKFGFENDVEFADDLTSAGKKEFLDSISVYCVPSRRKEAIGMHMIEAMAAQVPVVMPGIGAYSEIITKTGAGICYNPEDKEKLVQALKKVLSDKELYLELKHNCHRAVETVFNPAMQTNKIVDIYRQCLTTVHDVKTTVTINLNL